MTRQTKDSGIEWLGQFPENWTLLRGKDVMTPLARPITAQDEIITCFRDGEVTLRKNRREDGFTVALKEIGYQGIEPGDLVVHGMDGFAGSIGISDSRGKASPVLNVLDSKQNKRYLMYYLRALAYKEVYLALATGIRVRSCNLNWNKIGELPILLPTESMQASIVTFLDEKLGETDKAIASAEASIEEYQAYKKSVIFEAVTKGLDKTAEMKDSGIEWVGEIPSHWENGRWKYIFEERNEKNSPVTEKEILSLSASQGVVPYSERQGGGNKAKSDLSEYKIARAGDIVLNSMNVVSGSVALSRYIGCVSPVYYMFYLKSIGDIRYFNYLFQTVQFQRSLFGLGNGIMVKQSSTGKLNTVRMRISPSTLKGLSLPVAPLAEQTSISDHLDSASQEIDKIIAAKQGIIEELKAYKKSLIYEAVTGKREIPCQ